MLKELATREEVARTGVYVLAGPDPENPTQDMIYVAKGTRFQANHGPRQRHRQGVLDTMCASHQQGLESHKGSRSIP